MNIFRAGNGLEVLSPQQLVDCDSNNGVKRLNLNGLMKNGLQKYFSQGCNGGDEGTAFGYVVRKGLERESSYPYKGRDGSCYFHSSYAVAHMSNYGRVRRGDEDQLKWVVAKMVLTV